MFADLSALVMGSPDVSGGTINGAVWIVGLRPYTAAVAERNGTLTEAAPAAEPPRPGEPGPGHRAVTVAGNPRAAADHRRCTHCPAESGLDQCPPRTALVASAKRNDHDPDRRSARPQTCGRRSARLSCSKLARIVTALVQSRDKDLAVRFRHDSNSFRCVPCTSSPRWRTPDVAIPSRPRLR